MTCSTFVREFASEAKHILFTLHAVEHMAVIDDHVQLYSAMHRSNMVWWGAEQCICVCGHQESVQQEYLCSEHAGAKCTKAEQQS